MAHANIYIRKENEQTWDAIEDKSKWVNERLGGPALTVSKSLVETELPKEVQKAIKVINTPTQAKKALEVMTTDFGKVQDRGECKNGHMLDKWGRCSQKDCKYA